MDLTRAAVHKDKGCRLLVLCISDDIGTQSKHGWLRESVFPNDSEVS